MPKVKVGDTIKFRTGTIHSGVITATRKVKRVQGRAIYVGMFGYPDYMLLPGVMSDKILKVIRK